ncbi:MAG TPA: DUF5652 family protein [Candidatus Paceibacterota bacterium]
MQFGDIFIPLWLMTIVFIWVMIWKGIALWKAARNEHAWWFAALLVVNTLGILEIIYILWDIRARKKISEPEK